MTLLLFILFLLALVAGLLSGFPVAFVLAGISIIFAFIGDLCGVFDMAYLAALPNRIYGIMTNDLLIAVPLFVFMGCVLERAKIAEDLLVHMARLFGKSRAGLPISVMVVGALLAASTGIVGATVVTMGMISLPSLLKHRYSASLSCGTICAAGTLGQIIPPSIVLILLGDQISNAFQTAQMQGDGLAAEPVSIADIFMGALLPGLTLVGLYICWLLVYNILNPKEGKILKEDVDAAPLTLRCLLHILLPPLALILAVLGSILSGIATATESASIGAVGAMILAWKNQQLSPENMREVVRSTARVSCMVFTILIGAAFFTLVFRGYGGDEMVHSLLSGLPGGLFGAMFITMLLMFLLGFFLDFIEIIYVVVPIVAPVLLMMGADPVWLAVMIAINLQTSFLTPPFGFSLFYLRGVAPKSVKTLSIYKGVLPFVAIQLLFLVALAAFPSLATWLPNTVYGKESAIPRELQLETNSASEPFHLPLIESVVDF